METWCEDITHHSSKSHDLTIELPLAGLPPLMRGDHYLLAVDPARAKRKGRKWTFPLRGSRLVAIHARGGWRHLFAVDLHWSVEAYDAKNP